MYALQIQEAAHLDGHQQAQTLQEMEEEIRYQDKKKQMNAYYSLWYPIFLFVPKKIDGKWYWLRKVERRRVFYWGGTEKLEYRVRHDTTIS